MPEDASDGPSLADNTYPAGSPRAVVPLKTCAGCDGSLVRLGPNGECLRCLLGIDLSAEGGLLIDAVPPVERGRAQLLRFGHFDLVVGPDGAPVELGSGAMATTYRAHDTVLHCAVALKVIDTNVAANPIAQKRFLREARAAAKLRHANVAGVSHYGEQDGECYYAMELVEGETLESRVRREGPLPPAAALEAGVQIARALEAAEACGVVHRDLKPSNLMFVAHHRQSGGSDDPPVVKVIDWGLARVADADPILGADQTRDGFVGTPAFASPEQFAPREDRRVDTRSDIYSLGVTLWYLLCGRTPFVGRTLEAIHAQQKEPPFELLVAARVPRCMVGVLKRMLAVDPAARPQSSSELLKTLRRCQEQLAAERARASRRHHYRWLLAGLGVFAVLAIWAEAWSHRARIKAPLVDRTIAVLPFENLSPDKAEAFFASGMQEEMTAKLSRLAGLMVIGDESAAMYPPGNRDLTMIGHELGVSHLVEGSVRRDAGHVSITVQLIDPRIASHHWAKKYEGSLSDVFRLQAEITRDLTQQLGVEISPDEQTALDDPPTTDPPAHDLYLRAMMGPDLHDGPEAVRRALTDKVALLDEAVARDPHFALAYCRLAQLHDGFKIASVGTTAQELVVDHRTLAEVALQNARRLKPDDALLHLAQAEHFLITAQDREQARLELERARTALPNNSELENLAALVGCRLGRWEESLHAAEKAAYLQPHDPAILHTLAEIYRCLRRYGDTDRTVDRIMALGDHSLSGRLWRAETALDQRADLAPLRSVLATVKEGDDAGARDLVWYRLVVALRTHNSDAVLHALSSAKAAHIVMPGFEYPKAWFEGLAAKMRGDEHGAQAAFTVAKTDVEVMLQAGSSDASTVGLLAMIDAALGRKEDAVREGRQALDLVLAKKTATLAPAIACDLAVVYAWTGQPDLACNVLEEWVKRPASLIPPGQPTYGDLRLNPLWDSLRGYPRFESLVSQLAPSADR